MIIQHQLSDVGFKKKKKLTQTNDIISNITETTVRLSLRLCNSIINDKKPTSSVQFVYDY